MVTRDPLREEHGGALEALRAENARLKERIATSDRWALAITMVAGVIGLTFMLFTLIQLITGRPFP